MGFKMHYSFRDQAVRTYDFSSGFFLFWFSLGLFVWGIFLFSLSFLGEPFLFLHAGLSW